MSDHICPSTSSVFLDNFIRKILHDPEKILGQYIKTGYTAVDIGCGPGYFSIPMARLTGPEGKVIAADVQEEMLMKLKGKATIEIEKKTIKLVKAEFDNINVNEKADFILTFWMVHEVKDQAGLLRQIVNIMKPGSKYLLSEPKFHVTKSNFAETVKMAQSAGLKILLEPKIWFSRSIVFTI
jgi:ubiquinone/menaquinone biosynthesis C-methylase UbiE